MSPQRMTASLLAGGTLLSTAGFVILPALASSAATARPATSYPPTSLACKPLTLKPTSSRPPLPPSPSPSPKPKPTTSSSAPPGSGSGSPTGSASPTDSPPDTPTDSGSPTPSPTDPTPAPTDSGSAPPTTDSPSGTPTDTSGSGTPSGTPTGTAGATAAALDAYLAPAVKSQMCVGVQRAQASVKHGQAAQWVVSVYTTGATTTNAAVHVTAAPAGQHASFVYGCGKADGTAACALGTVDVGSAVRQVQAQVKVSAASTVTAVRLTASVSAAHLPARPAASVTVTVAAGIGASSARPADYLASPAFQHPSYLPLGKPGADRFRVTPGGNASGLFPVLTPGTRGPGGGASQARAATVLSAAGVAETGAQFAGLAVLALAVLLSAAPRVEVRVAGHRLTLPRIPRPRTRRKASE